MPWTAPPISTLHGQQQQQHSGSSGSTAAVVGSGSGSGGTGAYFDMPRAQSMTCLPGNVTMNGSSSMQDLAMLLGVGSGGVSSHNLQSLAVSHSCHSA
jgi:hypothetical protein